MLLRLSTFWADQGCVIALPYDVEVGAGTMCPETFLRVLGPKPWRVAYPQPSRRPADGRYGENPNRLIKHTQMQVILKPPPTKRPGRLPGKPRALSESTSATTIFASRKTTGRPPRWERGESAGR